MKRSTKEALVIVALMLFFTMSAAFLTGCGKEHSHTENTVYVVEHAILCSSEGRNYWQYDDGRLVPESRFKLAKNKCN